MNPLVGGAVVQGASNLLGGLVGLGGQAIANKANRKLAEYSYKKDLEMWNRQNTYNLPSNQMARLKEAGLNPNSLFGNGTLAGNTSGPAPKYNPPEIKLDTSRIIPDAGPILGQYQTMKMQQAQTNNIEADTLNKNIENANKIVTHEILRKQADKLGVDIEYLKVMNPMLVDKLRTEIDTNVFNLDKSRTLFPYQASSTKSEAQKSAIDVQQAQKGLLMTDLEIQKYRKEIEGLGIRNATATEEKLLKTYERQWMEKGVTKTDNLALRILARKMQDENIDPSSETGKTMFYNFLEMIDSWFGNPSEGMPKR